MFNFGWEKELLREEGFTIGRLDSRYKGIDKIAGGDRPDYWAELTSWNHSFAPAINYYFKNVLKFENCAISEKTGKLVNELNKKILQKAAVYQKQIKVKNFKPYDVPGNSC